MDPGSNKEWLEHLFGLDADRDGHPRSDRERLRDDYLVRVVIIIAVVGAMVLASGGFR